MKWLKLEDAQLQHEETVLIWYAGDWCKATLRGTYFSLHEYDNYGGETVATIAIRYVMRIDMPGEE